MRGPLVKKLSSLGLPWQSLRPGRVGEEEEEEEPPTEACPAAPPTGSAGSVRAQPTKKGFSYPFLRPNHRDYHYQQASCCCRCCCCCRRQGGRVDETTYIRGLFLPNLPPPFPGSFFPSTLLGARKRKRVPRKAEGAKVKNSAIRFRSVHSNEADKFCPRANSFHLEQSAQEG